MQVINKGFPLAERIRKAFAPKRTFGDVSGVYLGNERYLRVIQQPAGKPEYVSSISGVATHFQLAERHGNIGLLAHNYLGGRYFLDLKIGDDIYLMDGHRRTMRYRVARMYHYQALDPRSPRSQFIDLETRQVNSASDVFKRVYTGSHHLVLQTCIQKGYIKEWGRVFIIAEPKTMAYPPR
jgi:hypothetical protein